VLQRVLNWNIHLDVMVSNVATKSWEKNHQIDALYLLAHKFLPTLENNLKTPNGEPGWRATFYNSDLDGQPVGGPVAEYVLNDTRIKLNDFLPSGLGETWALKVEGLLTFDQSGEYELGVAVAGTISRLRRW
jgi:hypothetical protein